MIYLDNSATTRALPEVVEAVRWALEEGFGNPSSPHGLGARAERLLRAAREEVASALAVDPAEIIFTSGGTEANNLAILGAARALRRRGDHVITTAVEHPSVLNACRALEEEGFRLTVLPCDRAGRVSAEDLARALEPGTVLVSTMHVNNEVGTVQPLPAFAEVLRAHRGQTGGDLPAWHVDAVQSFLRLPVKPRELGVDLVSVSAHKVHGPKGVGVLYAREAIVLRALVYGGGQEGGRRSGTENVPGVAGFAAAVRAVRSMAVRLGGAEALAASLAGMRRRLAERILELVPWAVLNGPAGDGPAPGQRDPAGSTAAPHILSVAFPGLRGEVLVRALEEEGVYAATGAACSSRQRKASHVLAAMGLPAEVREGTLRFSLAVTTTADEVERAAEAVGRVSLRLRPFVRR